MPDPRTDNLHLPGADIYYQVRGQGPALLLIPGSNGDAGLYEALAGLLADRYTVISYDRRGFSRSALKEPPPHGWTPAGWLRTHTEDARRLLETVATGPAHVLGSSAGAVIGLALAAGHPDLVTRLVAHEPPLTPLLPDAARWQTFFEDVYVTYRRDGIGPAIQAFAAGTGLGDLRKPADADAGLLRRVMGNFDFFLAHEVRQAPCVHLDLAALDARQERIVMAGGEARESFCHRTSAVLADRWGRRVADFPGDHTGYWSRPAEFAGTLADALAKE
ncbi:alpha/beta hydrolase [Sphaerisporangium siamense]|uniref:Pimeloyl-ACP methyl ester carboxylesterase n=1 Tax=Sphaerisporangium siamense TaxID=795645 RepID=A0A7W7DEB7_9ACTN|nr:alpha/beta fold hydrolase [Sphaerisporangium siamense]MBB4705253.1 pimeloyl-ACP methyl ester carboxylesterase [Sphaerisporangium siamense]GII86595.1 alpha/beta hydrolase [Sphaerisporangium siamense]